MKLKNMEYGQTGWIYVKENKPEESFIKIEYIGDDIFEDYILIRETDKYMNKFLKSDTRIFKTKEEAIRFQIRIKNFEIYNLEKILNDIK